MTAARDHDRPSERLADASASGAGAQSASDAGAQSASDTEAPSASETAAPIVGLDPLSDVLRTVKLKGALFFLVDATSPWCVEVPHVRDFAEIILPSARHVVSYHVVVEGWGVASIPGSEPVQFRTGDVIAFPHGDPYLMSSAPGVPPELDPQQTLQFFRDLAAGKLPFVIPEGGGKPPPARFICGFLGCDLEPFNPLFSALPSLLVVRRPADAPTGLLDRLVNLAISEIQTPRAGGDSIRLGLSELMFVELLRRHLESLGPDRPGWLAGLRDPAVGRALALLHAKPATSWTLDALARAAGTSRSVLAERFGRTVGEPPMRYLKLWRMQMAARILSDGAMKIAAVAEHVGFRSEAAFSRSFKDVTGQSPSEWRRTRLRYAAASASSQAGDS